MSNLQLAASGLWCGTINEEFGPRVVLCDHADAGGRSTGKTTRLRLLEVILRGTCAELGKKPGEVARMAPGGVIKYSLSMGGRGVSGSVKVGAIKLPMLPDCAVQTLALDLDGSAESTRKWLSSAVQSPPEWTAEKVLQDFRAGGAKHKMNVTSLTGLAAAKELVDWCRDRKNEANVIVTNAEKAAAAHVTTAAASEVTISGSREQLEAKLTETNQAIAKLQAEYDVAFRSRQRRHDCEVAYNSAQEAFDDLAEVPAFKFFSTSDITLVEQSVAAALGKGNDIAAAISGSKKSILNLQERAAETRAITERLRERMRIQSERMKVLAADKCDRCGSSIPQEVKTLAHQELRATELELERAVSQEALANNPLRGDAEMLTKFESIERELTKELQTARDSVEMALSHNQRTEKEQANYHARVEQAQKACEAAHSAFVSCEAAREDTEIQSQIEAAKAERTKINEALGVARSREEAAAQAAKVKESAAKAKAERDAWVSDLEIAKTIRTNVVKAAIAKIESSVDRAAGIADARGIVDLGDDENDPAIGFTRNGKPVVLSGRETVLFRATLAAELLAQAQAPRERRVLLIEADPVPTDILGALMQTLNKADVGHIVIARCEPLTLVPSEWELVELQLPETAQVQA